MLDTKLAEIGQSYWFLGLVQVVHSIEETYTELYSYFGSMSEVLHQHFPWIPIFEISADLFAILNYLMIALMLGSVPSAEKGSQWGFYLMWSWAIIELLNGAFHIGTWLFLHHYFPGGVSGPILFVLSILFIQQLISASNKEATQITQ
ncbi:MAG: HXXEE domain-containing protein [Nostoc sp.]|uniref:HXXEE domain-containing protein n=1 Tax=Nostoc sp. TaxID=1180 RepID=UPI002FF54A5C